MALRKAWDLEIQHAPLNDFVEAHAHAQNRLPFHSLEYDFGFPGNNDKQPCDACAEKFADDEMYYTEQNYNCARLTC